MLGSIAGVGQLTLSLPQIHRRNDGGFFPGLSHDVAVATGDALLRAACAFIDDGKRAPPAHYRALGRSAYLAAALKADRKLGQIARSFDFLLSISPIDTSAALDRFLADKAEKPPRFHYRPLTIDPDLAKRDLYAIDLSTLEDPLLERLLAEKRREIDAQLTMLATRNTPAFRPASTLLYGAVDPPLLADALVDPRVDRRAISRAARRVDAAHIASRGAGADRRSIAPSIRRSKPKYRFATMSPGCSCLAGNC